MITDGQPSACFIDNIHQKNEIISEKPYSNFYSPDKDVISKVREENDMKLDINEESLVYLCYRYKKIDSKIKDSTIFEAKKCLVSQREVGHDTRSFANALRAAMREDPDIIFV